MNCAFFGSRDVGDFVRPIVRKAILDLIKNQKIDCFYVGNNGNFDFYVQCILAELKKEGYEIDFNIVLSHISEKALKKGLMVIELNPKINS